MVFLCFLNLLMWLGTFALAGLAVYFGHVLNKDVFLLVIGTLIACSVSSTFTGTLYQEVQRRQKRKEEKEDGQ